MLRPLALALGLAVAALTAGLAAQTPLSGAGFPVARPPAHGRRTARRRGLLVARRQAPGASRASASRAIPSTRSTRWTSRPATPRASPRASARRRARSSAPARDEILFASTHHDPKSKQYQDEELAFRASGKERRYAWDYDPEMEIYAHSEKTGATERLTNARGYDAEASYSPDGQWIVFSSMRDAYNRTAHRRREEAARGPNPSYFGEIYIMRADGSGPAAPHHTSPATTAGRSSRPTARASSGAASTSRGSSPTSGR